MPLAQGSASAFNLRSAQAGGLRYRRRHAQAALRYDAHLAG